MGKNKSVTTPVVKPDLCNIYVRVKPKFHKKAFKIKEYRGQTWVSYIERLIAKDKCSAVQE